MVVVCECGCMGHSGPRSAGSFYLSQIDVVLRIKRVERMKKREKRDT